jgi:thiosulfate oxidation carrier complex protein SoxZ
MSAPSLIRARMSGPASALVRVRMKHEMESGQRRDAQNRPVPAWHITEFRLLLNGSVVINGQFGGGISKDPFLEFTLKGVKPGDSLRLDWSDNRGDKRSDSAAIGAAA